EDVFEVHRVALPQVVIIASTDCAMDVDLQVLRTGVRDEIAEDVILEYQVFLCRRNAFGKVLAVDRLGFFTGRIGNIHQRPEIWRLKLYGNCALLFVLRDYLLDERLVTSQVGWQLGSARLGHIAMKSLFLNGKIDGAIRVDGEVAVVEGEHERIDENHPAKTRITFEVVHGDAVCHSDLNANLIEDLIPVILAPFLSQFVILLIEPDLVLGG